MVRPAAVHGPARSRLPAPPCPSPTVRRIASFLSAVLQQYDYVFSENGLVAYKKGELLAVQVGGGWHEEAGQCWAAAVLCSTSCVFTTVCRSCPPERTRCLPAVVQSISKHLGEDNLKEFINFCLKYLAGAG